MKTIIVPCLSRSSESISRKEDEMERDGCLDRILLVSSSDGSGMAGLDSSKKELLPQNGRDKELQRKT